MKRVRWRNRMAGVEAASRSNNKHQSRRGGSDAERRSKDFFMPDKDQVGPWMERITVALRGLQFGFIVRRRLSPRFQVSRSRSHPRTEQLR
jgi:hypothetical protein